MSDTALEELQIRLVFLENHLDELNRTLLVQDARIEKMQMQIKRLQQYQMRDSDPDHTPEPPPPHY